MADYQNIIVETHDKAGLIRINRPKALNALNSLTMEEMYQAMLAFDRAGEVGAIVVTGNDKAFAAGADIKEMMDETVVSMVTTDHIGSLYDRIMAIRLPIIAAVSGFALGGGNELAMACDMIVASETAVFGQPEINLGVIPGAGGTQRLLRAVGKPLAMEIVLNDRRLSADEAYTFGLVNRVYPVEDYLDEALTLANEIAERAPFAIKVAKEMVNKAYELPLREGLNVERRNFYALFGTEDQKEGMRAFAEKRKPQWTGQ